MELQTQPPTDFSVLTTLSDKRRRYIIRLLQDRISPVGLRELATNLAAEEENKPLVDVTQDEVADICADFVHVQLPKLEEADLITWNRETETVETTDNPALQDPKFQQIIDTTDTDWNAVLANLAHRRRRIILSVLKEYDGAMARAELAKVVVAREDGDIQDTQPTDAAEDLLVQLHHVHLPKLQQAGLISYNTDEGSASYNGHPALEDEWLDEQIDEARRAILRTAHHSDAI